MKKISKIKQFISLMKNISQKMNFIFWKRKVKRKFELTKKDHLKKFIENL